MPKTKTTRLQVRLPSGLYKALKSKAKLSKRSLNAEIVMALNQWAMPYIDVRDIPDEVFQHVVMAGLRRMTKDQRKR